MTNASLIVLEGEVDALSGLGAPRVIKSPQVITGRAQQIPRPNHPRQCATRSSLCLLFPAVMISFKGVLCVCASQISPPSANGGVGSNYLCHMISGESSS